MVVTARIAIAARRIYAIHTVRPKTYMDYFKVKPELFCPVVNVEVV